jgi:hypothetical protein
LYSDLQDVETKMLFPFPAGATDLICHWRGVAEVSSLLGYYAAPIGIQLAMFLRVAAPFSGWSYPGRIILTFGEGGGGAAGPENQDTTTYRNVGDYLPIDTAKHPRTAIISSKTLGAPVASTQCHNEFVWSMLPCGQGSFSAKLSVQCRKWENVELSLRCGAETSTESN